MTSGFARGRPCPAFLEREFTLPEADLALLERELTLLEADLALLWSTGAMDDATRTISRLINRSPAAVAAYAGDPANLPAWAAGLSSGIRLEGDRWITDSPMGTVEVRFTGDRSAGVLDHDVVFPDGTVNRNPFRVLPHGEVSEVAFTVVHRAGMSAADVDRDAAAVAADLDRLAAILEAD